MATRSYRLNRLEGLEVADVILEIEIKVGITASKRKAFQDARASKSNPRSTTTPRSKSNHRSRKKKQSIQAGERS